MSADQLTKHYGDKVALDNLSLDIAPGEIFCLLAPKAAVNMTQWLHPTPSWQAYQDGVKHDLENGVDGHDPYDAFTKKLEEETLQKHGVSTVDSLPFNWSGFIMQKGEEHETVVFQKHKDRLLNIYQNQQRVQQAAAVLSPWLLVGISSQRLAGTDIGTSLQE